MVTKNENARSDIFIAFWINFLDITVKDPIAFDIEAGLLEN